MSVPCHNHTYLSIFAIHKHHTRVARPPTGMPRDRSSMRLHIRIEFYAYGIFWQRAFVSLRLRRVASHPGPTPKFASLFDAERVSVRLSPMVEWTISGWFRHGLPEAPAAVT